MLQIAIKTIFIILLSWTQAIKAWETDQFTLPESRIADTGEDISTYFHKKLTTTLNQININRTLLPQRVKQLELEHRVLKNNYNHRILLSYGDKKKSLRSLKRKIKNLKNIIRNHKIQIKLSGGKNGIIKLISDSIGRPIAKQEKEDAIFGNITNLTPYSNGIKNGLKTRFVIDRLKTVYAYAGFHRILHPSYLILSSTINLYGFHIGMDKLGHFVNEGHKYYSKLMKLENSGLTRHSAKKKVVNWGIKTESTYYGKWVSGIYSNADLATNYAGMFFYINLFEKVTLNGITYDPIIKKGKDGRYSIFSSKDNTPATLLKRFISNHMNESLNPSSFEYLQYVILKKAILNRCTQWKKYYTHKELIQMKKSSSESDLWNSDDYGNYSSNTISIFNFCIEL